MLPCHGDLIDSTAVHSITICENSPSWDFPPKFHRLQWNVTQFSLLEERNLMGWQFQSIPAPMRWKISNQTCYHDGRNQEWHKKKKPLCREVPDLEGIIKMRKQEVAHELRRMQSRMLNLESWRTSYLWRLCMGCQQQKCWSYYLRNPLKSSSSTCSIPPSWLNPSPLANSREWKGNEKRNVDNCAINRSQCGTWCVASKKKSQIPKQPI